MSLVDELCRLFNSRRDAMECAMRHGQVTVDGYIVRPRHDRQWTVGELRGRYARLLNRQRQLYGAATVGY